jgi:hypothetical protein
MQDYRNIFPFMSAMLNQLCVAREGCIDGGLDAKVVGRHLGNGDLRFLPRYTHSLCRPIDTPVELTEGESSVPLSAVAAKSKVSVEKSFS